MKPKEKQELKAEADAHINILLGHTPATWTERERSVLRLREIIEVLTKPSGRRAKSEPKADQSDDGKQAPPPPDA